MGIEHMVFSLLLRANSLRRSLQSKVKKLYTRRWDAKNTNKCADGGAGSPIGLGTISTLNLKSKLQYHFKISININCMVVDSVYQTNRE